MVWPGMEGCLRCRTPCLPWCVLPAASPHAPSDVLATGSKAPIARAHSPAPCTHTAPIPTGTAFPSTMPPAAGLREEVPAAEWESWHAAEVPCPPLHARLCVHVCCSCAECRCMEVAHSQAHARAVACADAAELRALFRGELSVGLPDGVVASQNATAEADSLDQSTDLERSASEEALALQGTPRFEYAKALARFCFLSAFDHMLSGGFVEQGAS